jgi:hypothetical protein
MCFSAEASFATGAVLIPAGIYCVRSSLDRDPRYLALAVSPLVFAVQQACEGFVWLGLDSGDHDLARWASCVYLFFALVFWPCWVPFSALILEGRRWARRTLGGASAAALATSLFVFLPMAFRAREWLRPGIRFHSIEYDYSMLPAFWGIPTEAWHAGYVAVVALPLVVQGDWRVRSFSLMLVVSAILAQVAFAYAFISIWCAFAALLSAWLCFLFRRLEPVNSVNAVPGSFAAERTV